MWSVCTLSGWLELLEGHNHLRANELNRSEAGLSRVIKTTVKMLSSLLPEKSSEGDD